MHWAAHIKIGKPLGIMFLKNIPMEKKNEISRVKNMGGVSELKIKKRQLFILLPRNGYFKSAFVFGQKATDKIMTTNINEAIKTELQNAKVYTEGRCFSINIKKESFLLDIKRLVDIKLAH